MIYSSEECKVSNDINLDLDLEQGLKSIRSGNAIVWSLDEKQFSYDQPVEPSKYINIGLLNVLQKIEKQLNDSGQDSNYYCILCPNWIHGDTQVGASAKV